MDLMSSLPLQGSACCRRVFLLSNKMIVYSVLFVDATLLEMTVLNILQEPMNQRIEGDSNS